MADEEGVPPPAPLRTGRLEALSDGVFAVAITLLVLEISVPAGSEDDLLDALLDQWPSYLAYVVSFATIGAIWLAHNAVTHYLHHADALLLRLNLLLLLVVSFLPFPTRLLAESVEDDDAGKVATTFYGLSLLAAASDARCCGGTPSASAWSTPTRATTRWPASASGSRPGSAFYVVMIGLGLFFPFIAVLGYLAIAIFYLVPIRSLRHRT